MDVLKLEVAVQTVDIDGLGTPAFTLAIGEDGEFRFTGLNMLHTRLTGIVIDDIIGRTPHECLPADVAAHVEARYRRCQASGAVEEYEEELTFPLGRKWWRTTLTPLRDASGRHVGILGTAVDISESKRQELELVDPVTSLGNSRRFALDVADATHRANETGRAFSLIVVDIASSCLALSMASADELRRILGDRLREAVREGDRVARTDRDRLSAVVSAATEGALAVAKDRIHRKLAPPIEAGGSAITIAVGGAVWSPSMPASDLVSAAMADLAASDLTTATV